MGRVVAAEARLPHPLDARTLLVSDAEHHGDATPGAAVMIVAPDLSAYHADLLAQEHRNARPGIEDVPWGRTMTVTDPFGNRLVFWERSSG